jgi:aminocarboxymuconate-semialdehyde decarboxylase
MANMKIIDIDSHSRPRSGDYVVEPEFAHLRPRSFADAKGTVRHVFNDRILSITTADEFEAAAREGKSEWRTANYDAALRAEQVRKAGIDLQFVSTGTISAYNYVEAKAGAAFCRASNNFIHDNFMKPYPKLFTGLPALPLQDIPESIRELRRCVKDLGMMTFIMPTNTNNVDMADPHWWNFYEAGLELGIKGVVVHIGSLHGPWVGRERLAILGSDGTVGRRVVSGVFEYSTNIINLIFGGIMETFPDLRFAFLEIGARYAIILRDSIEENLGQIGYMRDMLAHPLDWYFDRFLFLVDDKMLESNGRLLRDTIEELGEDHLFVGSDYPHPDGHLDIFARLLAIDWLSAEAKEKIVRRNIEKFIGRQLVAG